MKNYNLQINILYNINIDMNKLINNNEYKLYTVLISLPTIFYSIFYIFWSSIINLIVIFLEIKIVENSISLKNK